jgi:hypothetical protein
MTAAAELSRDELFEVGLDVLLTGINLSMRAPKKAREGNTQGT